mmetsp:Transcript_23547/g.63368  ORF Transcript_23547/g.63368 Transcript_23547/m.63368 type:complete len:147 (+) Transcript_23547:274-714(+)
MNKFGNYYFVWAGFTNGAFLGYYDKDVVAGSMSTYNTISWMPSENHSCPYTVTEASWNSALDVEASGLEGIRWPYNDSSSDVIPRNCREYFHADHATGKRFKSFNGKPFDPRLRAWYYEVQRNLVKQWSNVYVDNKDYRGSGHGAL